MKVIKYMQEGGNMPAAPVEQGTPAQDPLMEIANMMAQGLQSGDCNILAQACEAFLSLLQQAQAPAREPIGNDSNTQPVFKKGGKLIKRKKCDSKQDGGLLKNKFKDKSNNIGEGAFSSINAKKVKVKF